MKLGISTSWPFQGPLHWCLVSKCNHFKSFQDYVPSGYRYTNKLQNTWLHDTGTELWNCVLNPRTHAMTPTHYAVVARQLLMLCPITEEVWPMNQMKCRRLGHCSKNQLQYNIEIDAVNLNSLWVESLLCKNQSEKIPFLKTGFTHHLLVGINILV